ncbi:MAG: hypothetical protein DHS20C13_24060 [Thermodesulfobacteriota bacterium]|nr:MAG: hypothetical protein DHS20C13_24060 [Thermodesulfobacteriota bacterium]
MDLFQPIVDESRFHKNFASILVPFRKAERDLLKKWSEGFVDRDGKLVKEFQTSFNSSFWEIYLHAVFKEYGFSIDWSNSTPDFSVNANGCEIIVEAVTANSAHEKTNEWDKNFSDDEIKVLKSFKKLNREAIIRISSAILNKSKKFDKTYKNLNHVKGKPFVLAVAPFEQPHFNLQYNRPIKALLYDYYVDEDIYLENPEKFPNGPPAINLSYVEKDNGTEIPLGIFNDSNMSEISAIIFSCTATWGKLSAIAVNSATNTQVISIWATPPDGVPEIRQCSPLEHNESILDGLQIFHNPFADYPLEPEVFRAERVVQLYCDTKTGGGYMTEMPMLYFFVR